MRGLRATWLLALCFCQAAGAAELRVLMLDPALGNPAPAAVAGGSLDARFRPVAKLRPSRSRSAFWLRLVPDGPAAAAGLPTLDVRKRRSVRVALFAYRGGRSIRLAPVAAFGDFLGTQNSVFVVPGGLSPDQPLYARVEGFGAAAGRLDFAASSLRDSVASAAAHARMIALAFGALSAMALAALLIWLLLGGRLLLLYSGMFFLQALYIGYLSGQAFDWPILSYASPLTGYPWNVPAALSGAVAALFVREIAELKRFSPRVYRVFGWFALGFVVLAVANVGQEIGLGKEIAAVGNVAFVGTAVFTLVVAFLAWRRDNRAAGWFLIAWGLLETLTIVTATRLLVADISDSAALLYYGLPSAMVAAAVLIALGVADRLRDQRLALTEAERRAQTDPLTGVLNRRSLLERLDAACAAAKARGLPLSLLFIDLDHFKAINDSFGHPAGDACLKAIVEPIQAELRQSDVIGRYGGEEFLVILSGADIGAARPIAERIRKRIAAVRVHGDGRPIRLTCSIGVATSDTLGVWGEHLIARADEAVYAAKRAGRNQVRTAVPLAA